MPTSRGDGFRRLLAVAGQQHGRQAELAQLANRLGARRLDGVADDERRARQAVPADGDLAVRAANLDLVALDAPDDADARPVRERLHGRQRADLGLRRLRDRLRDRMLARVLDGSGQPEHLGAARAVQRPHVDELHAALGHRARLVEDDRADLARLLEHLGPLDEDAELRAAAGAHHERRGRGEPEGAGARDDEHGHGRREGVAGVAGQRQPAGERGERDADDGRDEHGRDAVGEPLDRRLARLGLGDEAGDLGQGRLGADPRRAHDQPAVRVDGRSRDVRARPDVHRHRLARQHRLVDGRRAVLDDTVRRDLLPGPDDEDVADAAPRRSERAPPRRPGARAPPSRRARAARAAPRPRGSSPAPRGSGRRG